jgi:hypothetical protein
MFPAVTSFLIWAKNSDAVLRKLERDALDDHRDHHGAHDQVGDEERRLLFEGAHQAARAAGSLRCLFCNKDHEHSPTLLSEPTLARLRATTLGSAPPGAARAASIAAGAWEKGSPLECPLG